MRGHDDDIDWLYDRAQSRRPVDAEHTREMSAEELAELDAPATARQGSRLRSPAPTQRVSAAPPDARPRPAAPPLPHSGRRTATAARDRGGAGFPGGPGGYGPGGTGSGVPDGRRKKRRPVRTTLSVIVLVIVAVLVWLVAVPLVSFSQVTKVDDSVSGRRPAGRVGTTYLLVGSDSRQGMSAAEKKKLGTGSVGGQRTDTIMLLYAPPSGKPALISLPRDSYLPIPGHGSNKINAAYSLGGAPLLVQTVEQNTGLRIDHYVEIGFSGFVGMVDAVGGVDLCLPKAIKDKNSHINLKAGCQTLNGTNALGYVRMRYADPLGDLGRVQRQRQVVAAIAKKAASPATIINPVRYWKLNHAGADAVAVGTDTSITAMPTLGLALMSIAKNDGLTLTVPVANTSLSTPAGSAVQWDDAKSKEMFADIGRGDTGALKKFVQKS
ncbi:MAG: LCP family protein [Propionibacteriaceae bacterium]